MPEGFNRGEVPNVYEGDSGLRERNEFEDPFEEINMLVATEKLAQEVVNNQIKDIIFIDSSARPAAIALKEYWRIKMPDQQMPGLYFVNPFGFKNAEDIENMDLHTQLTGSGNRSQGLLSPEAARSDEQIQDEFEDRYHVLLEDKEQPLMVFDTCSHSGSTLSPILRVLENSGFKKVITVLASNHRCDITPDKVLLSVGSCYPFGADSAVLKHQGSVESLRAGGYEGQTEEAKIARDRAKRLRDNIRVIIRKEFSEGQNE